MGRYTDVVLIVARDEDVDASSVRAINEWLRRSYHHGVLFSTTGSGPIELSDEVWLGCLRNLDDDAFVALVAGLTWSEPDAVVLLVKGEEDDTFTSRLRWMWGIPHGRFVVVDKFGDEVESGSGD